MPDDIKDQAGNTPTGATPPAQVIENKEAALDATDSSVEVDDFDFSVFENSVPGETVPDVQPPAVTSSAPAETVGEVKSAPAPVEPQAATPPPAPPQPQQVEATPPAPQVTPGAPQEQQVQPPQAGTTQATPPPTTAQAPATESPPDGFRQLDQAIEQSREKVIDAVAAQTYQLTQEELEAVQVEPEKAIPKLLARVHVNTVQGVVRHIAQQMPALVSALITQRDDNSKREKEFFDAWPQLDRQKHSADIIRVGQVFRQLNPNATMQDFIRHVGAQVVLANGLHIQQQKPQQTTVAPPPPQQPAFVPAGVGRTSAPAAPSAPTNPWEEMVEVMRE